MHRVRGIRHRAITTLPSRYSCRLDSLFQSSDVVGERIPLAPSVGFHRDFDSTDVVQRTISIPSRRRPLAFASLACSGSSVFIASSIHRWYLACLYRQDEVQFHLPVFPALTVALADSRAPCSAHPTGLGSLTVALLEISPYQVNHVLGQFVRVGCLPLWR